MHKTSGLAPCHGTIQLHVVSRGSNTVVVVASAAERPSSRAVMPGGLEATAGERWRPHPDAEIARALHDRVAQDLFVARMALHELSGRLQPESAERGLADDALGRIGAALQGTRQLVEELRAGNGMVDRDLAPLLRRELIDFSARSGIAVAYSESGPSIPQPPKVAAHALAIVREALANVEKHADASEVRVRARHRHGWTRLTVADDGRGFRVTPAGRFEAGLGAGLDGMHERAREVGGRIAIRSAASSGTTVTLDIPPPRADADAG
jgi:two-component system NarL family sensor kinase